MLRAEQDRWRSAAQLAAEHDTVSTVGERDRWVALLHRSGLDASQVDAVLASDAFGPLCATLRRADAAGYDVDVLVQVLARPRPPLDADDVAAVFAGKSTHLTAARTVSAVGPAARGTPTYNVGTQGSPHARALLLLLNEPF